MNGHILILEDTAARVVERRRVLDDLLAGSSAVAPFDDLRWIDTVWRSEIEHYLRRGMLHL